MEKEFADQQSEDGITEELEALVIGRRGLYTCGLGLVGTGTVRNGAGQQGTVGEAIAEGALEFVEIGLQITFCPAAWTWWRVAGPPARCSSTGQGYPRCPSPFGPKRWPRHTSWPYTARGRGES